MLTAYVAETGTLAMAPLLAALAASLLSLAQRRLSTPARLLRRRAGEVEGTVTLDDGATIVLDRKALLGPLEQALRAMSWSIVLLRHRVRPRPAHVTLDRPVDDLRRMLRRALAELPTVTGFLESLTGEPLVADVMSQGPGAVRSRRRAGGATGQDGDPPDRPAARAGGTPYVYADTAFVPGRLPEGARRRLAHGDDPIGRVLVDEGLEPVRLPALAEAPWRRPAPAEPEAADAGGLAPGLPSGARGPTGVRHPRMVPPAGARRPCRLETGGRRTVAVLDALSLPVRRARWRCRLQTPRSSPHHGYLLLWFLAVILCGLGLLPREAR